jgi:hypothetical protein
MKQLLIPAIALLAAMPAQAAANLGFESGSTSGWTTSGTAFASTGTDGFTPQLGSWFGVVSAGSQDVYSTLTQSFTLAAGKRIRGFVGFKANDYLPFNDDAYLTVNGTPLFTASVASVGDFGSTGWQAFSFQAPVSGTYTLELGVANRGDSSVNSVAVLDATVPEPATWTMLIAGFAMVGLSSRRRVARAAN